MTDLQELNIGSAPGAEDADEIREGGDKIKFNFTELDKRTKIKEFGDLIIFKAQGNTESTLQVNDLVQGFWSSTIFWKLAKYIGTDPEDIESYDVIESLEF